VFSLPLVSSRVVNCNSSAYPISNAAMKKMRCAQNDGILRKICPARYLVPYRQSLLAAATTKTVFRPWPSLALKTHGLPLSKTTQHRFQFKVVVVQDKSSVSSRSITVSLAIESLGLETAENRNVIYEKTKTQYQVNDQLFAGAFGCKICIYTHAHYSKHRIEYVSAWWSLHDGGTVESPVHWHGTRRSHQVRVAHESAP
jgi:hypothetical protein